MRCRFKGCERPHRADGLCHAHFKQQWKGKALVPLYARKRSSKSPPRIMCDEVPCRDHLLIGPCHVFRGSKTKGGYGQIAFNETMIRVHRYVWEREFGQIPDGLLIDHRCRNRACCNVDHLRLVTPKVNVTENAIGNAHQLNAAKTHCKRGHEFTLENTYVWLNNGRRLRQCRECGRQRQRKLYRQHTSTL